MVGIKAAQNFGIVFRVDDDPYTIVVFRGCSNQRYTADVDVLD